MAHILPFPIRKKHVFFACFTMSLLLAVIYVIQLNMLTGVAYHIGEQEERITQLKYTNADLQAQSFQAVSLRDINQLALQKQFVKTEHMTYLEMEPAAVAQQ